MNRLTLLLLLAVCHSAFAQTPAQNILNEGLNLYKMELLSWDATDYIYEKANMGKLKGYLCYRDKEQVYRCIFWNGAYDNLEVVHSFWSSDPAQLELMKVDNAPRQLTEFEQLLYDIKMRATLEIKGNPEFFTLPADTRFYLLFSEDKININCFVMLKTSRDHVVPLGNDFVMSFNRKGELLSKAPIQKSYVEIRTDAEMATNGEALLETLHSIEGSGRPYISPTDICNLLLFSGKKSQHVHRVFSDSYVSVFSLKDKTLDIIPVSQYKKGKP